MGARAVGLVLLLALVGGCTAADPEPAVEPASETASDEVRSESEAPRGSGPAWRRAYDVALSEPVEDSLYPEVGDPGVDALHYELDLTWDPERSVLSGRQRLVLRATESASSIQLDLAGSLEVSGVEVDGRPATHRQQGKDLVVETAVTADDRYVVELVYSGEPGPVAAPTSRADVPGLGWTVTPDGSVWTMQEPFGAYTWYAVNDQPSDKALYDFTLRVPRPMVGVANGELVSRRARAGRTVTRWSLDEPAASYLVTVAFDRFRTAEGSSADGVPVTVWAPRERSAALPGLRDSTVAALDWATGRLGPYPFDTLGVVFVDSRSGMETQTMITLGLTPYAMSDPVIVHEVVHQWWGDQVSPADWRDLWMNEGMTMYLQLLWESEQGGRDLESTVASWSAAAQRMRDEAGPPGDFDPDEFARDNVYVLPALLWHEVRERLGDEEFFRLVRGWPAARDNRSTDRDDLVRWWEQESGEELADLFESHLLDDQQPVS